MSGANVKEVMERAADKANRVSSARAELRDSEFADMFRALTPQQKLRGQLLTKIIQSRGNVDIEAAWSWYEVESGEKIGYSEKIQTLMLATAHLGLDQTAYNAVRKEFIKANNKE